MGRAQRDAGAEQATSKPETLKPANSAFHDKRTVDKRGSAKGVVDVATERSIRSGVQSFTALEEAIAGRRPIDLPRTAK